MESILAQTAVLSGRIRLQYLVCDGGSRDRTVDVVRELCGAAADVRSARDAGMYDALAGGLRRAEGDVVGYLNAGDVYDPAALDAVASAIGGGACGWVTGRIVRRDETGTLLTDVLPFRYRRDLLVKRMYGTRWLPFFVQQESTFFARELLEHVDLGLLAGFKLAGDAFLWSCFARVTGLQVLDARLGAFTVHRGQLSEDLRGYRAELARGADRRSAMDYACAIAERALWHASAPLRRRWSRPLASRENMDTAT